MRSFPTSPRYAWINKGGEADASRLTGSTVTTLVQQKVYPYFLVSMPTSNAPRHIVSTF